MLFANIYICSITIIIGRKTTPKSIYIYIYMMMILEKNYQTLYSSMMGRPNLRPQLVKVRTRKTRPQRNRKDEILGNLVLSLTSS